MIRSFWIGMGAILISIWLLAACQSKFFTAEGRFVAEEKRTAIELGGSASGSWQGKTDLVVEYTMTTTAQSMQIAGEIVFRRTRILNTFQCMVVLIDANGNVLQVEGIVSSGGRDEVQRIPFSREIKLPPAARYFAFSYSGTSGGRGNSSSPNSFWSSPW